MLTDFVCVVIYDKLLFLDFVKSFMVSAELNFGRKCNVMNYPLEKLLFFVL